MNDNDIVAKITIIGDSSVGKTNIISRFINNTYTSVTKPTIGVEISSKILERSNTKIKIILWDTAGQERYRSITNSFYNNSKGAFIVFDLTRKKTFESAKQWINEFKQVSGSNNIIIIGNKNDLNDNIEISNYDINQFAQTQGYNYIETSALKNINIKEAFDIMVDMLYKDYQESTITDSKEILLNSTCFNESIENRFKNSDDLNVTLVKDSISSSCNC